MCPSFLGCSGTFLLALLIRILPTWGRRILVSPNLGLPEKGSWVIGILILVVQSTTDTMIQIECKD